MITILNLINMHEFYRCKSDSSSLSNIPSVVYIQGVMILASVYIVRSTAYSIQQMEGLPVPNQLGSWILLCK